MNKPVKTPPPATAHDGRVTPMMAQYLEIKAANPDCLLFYRMGDFYELFFADAEIASRALGIALTKRGKHLGEDIPMCGVPVHAAGEYLKRLIQLGHRVAVCEQTEDPAEARKRGSKAVVRREVSRLVTPGTLTEDDLLNAGANNFVAAIAGNRSNERMALAWMDISTGEFHVGEFAHGDLAAELARVTPRELIVSEALLTKEPIAEAIEDSKAAVTAMPVSRFDSIAGERVLKEVFQIATMEAYGAFTRAEIAAAGALVDYVTATQVGRTPRLVPPRRHESGEAMVIDAATRANLEISRTLSGARKGSLLSAIDMAVTGPGSRVFEQWLANPLAKPDIINARLEAVAAMVEADRLRGDIRSLLGKGGDMARALGRLSLGRAAPKDLAGIRDGLDLAREAAELLAGRENLAGSPELLAGIKVMLAGDDGGLADELTAALADDLPGQVRDGGMVRCGYSGELDELRQLRDDARKVMARLQAEYAERTGIRALKIRHNNVLGAFIEVPAGHGARLMQPPHDVTFVHRQTLASAMRFTTTELIELVERIAVAAERATAIEQEIFNDLSQRVMAVEAIVSAKADGLAQLDVIAALGELARRHNYCRPRVDDSLAFEIEGGRHPVVEQADATGSDQPFIANDCRLGDSKRVWLLTGPNMAGKSTFLRQNALIAILAQAGSFVPAESAHIGIVDRLFSRVGAADDLARGRSTFMVEMVETAAILNQAGERALVILDEIGRGTATFDGMAIAWACIEHLHEVNRCRTLFATHYHELTGLAARLEHMANMTMAVREWEGEVIFLHEVIAGVADGSYGIQVARLAGLPAPVIARARQVLEKLEQDERYSRSRSIGDDLPLFSAAIADSRPPGEDNPALKRLAEIAPDELSPRQALDLIYELKRLVDRSAGCN